MNRRDFLELLGLTVGAGWCLAGCGPGQHDATDSSFCSREVARAPDDWVEIPLAEHPELAAVGGFVRIDRPDNYLAIHVVHYEPGCYLAASRICTHGACELDVNEVAVAPGADAPFSCPCHGSKFGPDGHVVQGPATEPITTFDIQKTEESLWVQPPQLD